MNLYDYALIGLFIFIFINIYQESDVYDNSVVYVFCYGELINLKTVKEINQPKESWPVMINGLKRSLNVGGKNHLVFGVDNVNGEWCNGVLIKVSPDELMRLKKRERLYTLKTLDKDKVTFPYKKTLQFNSTDTIVYFYPKDKYVLTNNELANNSQSFKAQHYLHLSQTGAAEIGQDFYNDFMRTTTTTV
jgi:hypothetical protein